MDKNVYNYFRIIEQQQKIETFVFETNNKTTNYLYNTIFLILNVGIHQRFPKCAPRSLYMGAVLP